MAKNDLPRFLQEIDRVFATTLFNGPKAAAERTVRELQQEGPSWTGRFSNSWQIETPTGVTKGDGQSGEPRPIFTPSVTGRQATRSFLSRDKVVFRISNFSPYAAEATDLVQGAFIRPTPTPQTRLGMSKWQVADTGRRVPSFRWDTGGGAADSESSRTASQDWLASYAGGGRLNKAVQIEMDAAMRGLR